MIELAPAEPVRQRPGEAPEHRAEQQRGDDGALQERREVEVLLDEEDRAGDDARVVAEQQPAERAEENSFRSPFENALLTPAIPGGALPEPTQT